MTEGPHVPSEEHKRETDYLEYRGSEVPKVIRLAWTVFILFGLYYLAVNLVPDLKHWMKLIK